MLALMTTSAAVAAKMRYGVGTRRKQAGRTTNVVTTIVQQLQHEYPNRNAAMDLLYAKEERDLLTGLKARTIPGRPNWDEVFRKIKLQMKGEVTIFYCGNPGLATTLKYKCEQFGFIFRKEVY